MDWFQSSYDDPLWRRMLTNFTSAMEIMFEVILPILLGFFLIPFVVMFVVVAIANGFGWDPNPSQKPQESTRKELTRELTQRVEGKTGPGSSENRDDLETLKMEVESLQEMVKERTQKLVSLATREKNE